MVFLRQLLSLEEARRATDGYVILDGEFGGICYIICPAKLVMCDEKTLRSLVHDLEDAIFPGFTQGAKAWYARLGLNEEPGGYALGEESGIALDIPWLPSWLSETGLDRRIKQVLAGELRSLGLSASEQAMVKVRQKEHHVRKFAELTNRD